MKELRFYEYGGFQDPAKGEISSISELPLSPSELQYLRSISEFAIPDKKIFDFSSSSIRATSMVGVISFGGVHIEILPKLLRTQDSDSSILKNLMFMLSYTNSMDISDSGIGSLAQNHDSFIEAYISIFASRLSQHLIRFGSPKAYVEKSENLNALKGKISFAKQSTINCFDQSKVFCDYSEFTENNPLSKALKFVAQSLRHLTRNSSSLTSLSRCVGLLDGVKGEYVSGADLDRCALGKREPNFIALINLTKMFLKKLRPEFSGQKKNKVFTLLFDMNELFEEFIFQILKENESYLNVGVHAQKHKRLVSAERDFLNGGKWEKRPLFATYTDIVVTPKDGRRRFIIDTKYKIVHSDKNHYGISNQDAYQILAYRQIHKTNSWEPAIALLYPQERENLQKEFQISGSDTTFIASTINISVDLKSSLPLLVDELRTLIDRATSSNRLSAA